METVDTLPGLTEANSELDRLMAADAAEDQAAGGGPGQSATDGQPSASDSDAGTRAAQASSVENAQGQPKTGTETLATAEQDKAKLQTPEAKAAAEKAAAEAKAAAEKAAGKTGTEPSKYALNRERRERSWAELNAQKEAFKAERAKLESDWAEFEQQRQESEQQFTPEAYEAAAKKFEAEGKFDLAELAAKKAKELRANPPKPGERAKAVAARTEAQRKEWALKAGTDFPEIAKDNSPLQVRVAQLMKEEPDLKSHPKGIYVAARIASLEAAAASVPAKDAELAKLRAKVKEFEELTAPGGQGAATRLAGERTFEQKSDEEQYAELTAAAHAQGSLV